MIKPIIVKMILGPDTCGKEHFVPYPVYDKEEADKYIDSLKDAQRWRKVCEYCEPKKYKSLPITSNILEFNPSKSKMNMQGNKILMEFELKGLEYEATMTVNYCPQCGRKLEGK